MKELFMIVVALILLTACQGKNNDGIVVEPKTEDAVVIEQEKSEQTEKEEMDLVQNDTNKEKTTEELQLLMTKAKEIQMETFQRVLTKEDIHELMGDTFTSSFIDAYITDRFIPTFSEDDDSNLLEIPGSDNMHLIVTDFHWEGQLNEGEELPKVVYQTMNQKEYIIIEQKQIDEMMGTQYYTLTLELEKEKNQYKVFEIKRDYE